MQLKFYFGFYLNKTHQIEANNNVQACFNDIWILYPENVNASTIKENSKAHESEPKMCKCKVSCALFSFLNLSFIWSMGEIKNNQQTPVESPKQSSRNV